MERLDTVTQRVLADLRNRVEGKAGEVLTFPGELARVGGGNQAPALASCENRPKRRNRRRRRKAG
jgi:hypothetical protein